MKRIQKKNQVIKIYQQLHTNTTKYTKKHRYKLVDEPIKQPNRRFLRIDLALKIIIGCRTDESCSFKRNLGFKLHDLINTKEQTVINSIKDAFEGEDMQTQYSVLGYRIDLYFHKYKLAIEVDELDMLIEISIMKLKDKKHQKENLIVYLLELILMKLILTFFRL